MKDFTTLSKFDCLNVYPFIRQNSDKKWTHARRHARKGDYGEAIANHIISIEELIKALIIALDSQGFLFRKIKGVDVLFKSHQIRHFIAYGLFLLSRAGTFMDRMKTRIQQGDKAFMSFAESIRENSEVKERFARVFMARQLAKLKRELDYFASVEKQRQNGTYCDYPGILHTPQHFTREEYLDLYSRMRMVRCLALQALEVVKTGGKQYTDQLDEIKTMLNQQQAYRIIGELLAEVRPREKDPFTVFASFLNSVREFDAE